MHLKHRYILFAILSVFFTGALWKIDIPAEGKTTLTYRAQVKY